MIVDADAHIQATKRAARQRLDRQTWLSRLLIATPRILAAAEYARIGHQIEPGHRTVAGDIGKGKGKGKGESAQPMVLQTAQGDLIIAPPEQPAPERLVPIGFVNGATPEPGATIGIPRIADERSFAEVAVYPTYSGRGVQNRLDHLLDNDLLWRVQTRTVAANHAAEYTKVRKQGAYAYGLSDQGKELLNTLEVERDPLTLDRLRSRDSRGRKPDLRTVSHDLQVSWWCLNLILAAAQNRFCRSVYVQTEFYPERSQRIDALVIVRLRPNEPLPDTRAGAIHFFDGSARSAGEIDVRLALEVDKGTEELKVLLEKAEKYRDLHRAGIYTATLGGPVLPVFLVQTPRRAAQIAKEFQDIWPSGWGVAGTPSSANSLRDGVLWGKYLSLTNSEPFNLLTNMVVDTQGRVQFFPAISRDEWRKGVVIPETQPLTASQESGRAGGKQRAALARARKEGQGTD